MSVLQGGKFGYSFISAGISARIGASDGIKRSMKAAGSIKKLITQVTIGGTVSRIGGGKFANGAGSAAFSMMLGAAYGAVAVGGATSTDGTERGGDNAPSNGNAHDLEQLGLGDGRYSYEDGANQYGTSDTVGAIDTLGDQWVKNDHNAPRVGVGDLSVDGGGQMRGHDSHQNGMNVDIRPMRNDGIEGSKTYESSNYSSELTQKLVNTIRQNPNVKMIFFNDSNVKGVSPWKGHDNHLHIRYKR